MNDKININWDCLHYFLLLIQLVRKSTSLEINILIVPLKGIGKQKAVAEFCVKYLKISIFSTSVGCRQIGLDETLLESFIGV